MEKVNVDVVAKISFSFYSYGSKRKNAQVARQLRDVVKDVLQSECSNPAIYVKENGEFIEDCGDRTRLRVQLVE